VSAPRNAPGGRRAEYAAATRRAIEEAAQDLFSARGYFATTVEDIAAAARVAPATVYAVSGGKQGLLKTVIEARATAPDVAETYAHLAALGDADELIRFIARETRARFERSRDLMRVLTDTAPHEPSAARALETAHASLRGGLARAAQRLAELGALAEGIDTTEATDRLWFYLGNGAYFTLTGDNRWPLDKAEAWLRESLRTALLRPRPGR
jgi:AcrR family transcriptional regulator